MSKIRPRKNKPLPDFPQPATPAYQVLPETAIPLQAASKLVGWVAAGVQERLEHVIREECAAIRALLPQRKKR